MEERRDPPPARRSRAPVISSIAGRLPPPQQTWSDYVDHGLSCPRCRSLDGGPCEESARLYRIYQDADRAAHAQLFDDTP